MFVVRQCVTINTLLLQTHSQKATNNKRALNHFQPLSRHVIMVYTTTIIIIILINALTVFAIPSRLMGCGEYFITSNLPLQTQKLFCVFLLMHSQPNIYFDLSGRWWKFQWEEYCFLKEETYFLLHQYLARCKLYLHIFQMNFIEIWRIIEGRRCFVYSFYH